MGKKTAIPKINAKRMPQETHSFLIIIVGNHILRVGMFHSSTARISVIWTGWQDTMHVLSSWGEEKFPILPQRPLQWLCLPCSITYATIVAGHFQSVATSLIIFLKLISTAPPNSLTMALLTSITYALTI